MAILGSHAKQNGNLGSQAKQISKEQVTYKEIHFN